MSDSEPNYDAIVVGAGAGGLSAALSLSLKGWKVLVAEKNVIPGGNCTSRDYGGYTFDLAVHQLSGIAGGGVCAGIMREYGIADKLDFRKVDPFLVIDMPDRSYTLHADKEALREELGRDFPDDKDDIDRMISGLGSMRKDALLAQRLLYGPDPVLDRMITEDVGLKKILTFPFTFLRDVALRMNSDADSVLRRWVRNPKLRSVILSSWAYLGLPPSRLSGLMMSIFVSMQQTAYSYYPAGGSQKLADVMAMAIRERGGEILLNSPVRRILTGGGRAEGVELEDGKKYYARIIISNADLRHTYGSLLQPGTAPAGFMKRLKDLPVALGPFRVCLGLDYNVAEHGLDHHEYMLSPGYDHEATYDAMARGEASGVSLYSPTKLCPELAPAGHSTLILTTLMPWRPEPDWRGRKEEIAARMIAVAEQKRLPGLSGHIAVKKILTPEDLQTLTNSSEGSMYGWANTPSNTIARRVSMKSPVRGLYHVGHWTKPGTGVTSAILSGWMLGNRLDGWVGRYLDRLL